MPKNERNRSVEHRGRDSAILEDDDLGEEAFA